MTGHLPASPDAAGRGAAVSEDTRPARGAVDAVAWRDLGVVTVLAALGVWGFAPAFSDPLYLLAGIGGLVVGTAAGYVSRLLRLNAFTTVVLAAVAYFVFGSALAVPSQAIAFVVPSLESLRALALGGVFGWTDIVTLPAPVAQPLYIDVLPYISGWLIGLVNAVLALRWLPRGARSMRRVPVLLVAPGILYLLGVVIGTSQPYLALIRGIAFAVIALVWLGWRRTAAENAGLQDRRGLVRAKAIGSGVIALAAIVVAGVAGSTIVPPADARFVLRDEIVPPFDPLDYPSPLSGFRQYTKDLADTELFRLSGLEAGDRIRLAVMDSYDGRLWNVSGPGTAADGSGSFTLVGQELPEPPLISSSVTRSVDVTVMGYRGVWLPVVGYPSTLRLDDEPDKTQDLRYNATTATAVITSGVASGYEYSFNADLQDLPSDEELANVPTANVQLPPVGTVPDIVAAKSAEFVGDATTPIAQLRAVETALHTNGFLSHGLASEDVPSRAGHGADRIEELFTRSQMIGDEEQFASAFALIARSLGFPARVVMGFAPENADDGTPITVTGESVTAWVEVPFEGVGWVPFFPTPDEKEVPQDQTPKPKTEPQPQVRQPPRASQQDDDLLTNVEIDDKDEDDKDQPFVLPGWVWVVGGVIGIPLLLYLIPFLIVAAIKRRRRTRRKNAPEAHRRAAGAWDELVDQHAELGFVVPRRVTRTAVAESISAQYTYPTEENVQVQPQSTSAALATLARDADHAVFSGTDVPEQSVEHLWDGMTAQTAQAEAAVGWWRRQLSRFRVASARSLTERLSAPRTEASRRVRGGSHDGQRRTQG